MLVRRALTSVFLPAEGRPEALILVFSRIKSGRIPARKLDLRTGIIIPQRGVDAHGSIVEFRDCWPWVPPNHINSNSLAISMDPNLAESFGTAVFRFVGTVANILGLAQL